MKTIKSLKKWIKGHELQPGDLNRLDRLWMEIKCVVLTAIIVFAFVWLLWVFGTFEGREQWQINNN